MLFASLFFQGTEEVQVPTQPQAGVQFGARGTNGRVSLLHSSLSCCFYVSEQIEQGFVNHFCPRSLFIMEASAIRELPCWHVNMRMALLFLSEHDQLYSFFLTSDLSSNCKAHSHRIYFLNIYFFWSDVYVGALKIFQVFWFRIQTCAYSIKNICKLQIIFW